MQKLTEKQVDEILTTGGFERIGSYVSGQNPIEIKCVECGYVRSTNASRLIYSIRKGQRPCPKCSNRIPHTDTEIDQRLQRRPIVRLSPWIDDLTPMVWKCTKCEHCWKTRLTKILNEQTGCPKCSYCDRNENRRLSNEEIDTRIEERPIRRISSYTGSMNNKIEWKCLDCGYEWKASASKVVNSYTGCPHCADVGGGKFGRKVLRNGIKFDSQLEADCFLIVREKYKENDIELQKRYPHNNRMKCDFFIRSKELWIEVSTLKTKEYLNRIKQKHQQIEKIKNQFIFCDSPTKLRKML